MNIAWRRYSFPTNGLARGYLKSAYYLHRALEQCPMATITDLYERPHGGLTPAPALVPNVVLHVCPPHFFKPLSGKTNVLYSMWETDDMPDAVIEQVSRAQRLLVPSTYVQRIFGDRGLKSNVVPLGVSGLYLTESDERTAPAGFAGGRPLRFLFVGSDTARKGWHLLAPAFEMAFGSDLATANAMLYLKTIGAEQTIRRVGKAISDTRDFSESDMAGLYLGADVFVFPTLAEGFGLPALEAMAAGALVIAPKHSGLADFVTEENAIVLPTRGSVKVTYGQTFDAPCATVEDLSAALLEAYEGWGTPAMESRRAKARETAMGFGWGDSALRLVAALSDDAPATSYAGMECREEGVQ